MTVGGTRQDDDYDTSVRESDRNAILERAFKVVPALKVVCIRVCCFALHQISQHLLQQCALECK